VEGAEHLRISWSRAHSRNALAEFDLGEFTALVLHFLLVPLPHNRDLSAPPDLARRGCLNVVNGSLRSSRGQTVYEYRMRSHARPPLCQPLTPASISRNLLSFMIPCSLPRCSKASTRAELIPGKLKAGQIRDPSVLSTPGGACAPLL